MPLDARLSGTASLGLHRPLFFIVSIRPFYNFLFLDASIRAA